MSIMDHQFWDALTKIVIINLLDFNKWQIYLNRQYEAEKFCE